MKKLLLLSGMSAAILYFGTVIFGGLIRPGYSHLSEAISELVAEGAPNRSRLSSLFLIYNMLLSTFGLGVFLKAKDQLRGQISGYIGSFALLLIGAAGISMELAFPQDSGGIPTTFAGTMHLVLAGVASLGTMVAIVFMAFWFRNFPALESYVTYSWISVAIIFISGGFSAAAMANHHSLFGLVERITIGIFILWLFVIGRRMVQLEDKSSRHMYLEAVSSTAKGRS